MKKVCITHAWNAKLTKDHIIWLNPLLLYERLKFKHHCEVDIKPINRIALLEYDKLIIFITGSIPADLEERIIASDVEVDFIIEDPNYDIDIADELAEKANIFTPYRTLEKYKKVEDKHKALTMICNNYHFAQPKDYHYLPTGVLPLYSKWYSNELQKFKDQKYADDLVRQNIKTNSIYCGSLKEERFQHFTQEDFDEGIDFYTNKLTKHRAYEVTNLLTDNIICHQRIEPLDVPHAMSFVDKCYFLIDDKMQALDSIYLRYVEMAYANNLIEVKGPAFQKQLEELRLIEFGMEDGRLSWEDLKKNWKSQLTALDRNIRNFMVK